MLRQLASVSSTAKKREIKLEDLISYLSEKTDACNSFANEVLNIIDSKDLNWFYRNYNEGVAEHQKDVCRAHMRLEIMNTVYNDIKTKDEEIKDSKEAKLQISDKDLRTWINRGKRVKTRYEHLIRILNNILFCRGRNIATNIAHILNCKKNLIEGVVHLKKVPDIPKELLKEILLVPKDKTLSEFVESRMLKAQKKWDKVQNLAQISLSLGGLNAVDRTALVAFTTTKFDLP